jgi:hypothetical protein
MQNPIVWIQQTYARLEKRRVSRRMRRICVGAFSLTVALYLFEAFFYLHPWRPTWQVSGRWYGLASFIAAWTAMTQAFFWMWFLGRIVRSPTLDELAQLDFGKPYDALSVMHRFDVRVRVRREMNRGGRPADERDALLERDAERMAFRLLRIALPVLLMVFWLVCLALPAGEYRAGLVMGVVMLTLVAIPVLVLPQAIRMWMEPDAAGELPAVILPEA